MSEGIVIAIIGAVGAIIVAIINKFVGRKGSSGKEIDGPKTVINQTAEGNGTTQIGIQVSEGREKND